MSLAKPVNKDKNVPDDTSVKNFNITKFHQSAIISRILLFLLAAKRDPFFLQYSKIESQCNPRISV
jgi:hypothetical protein